MLNTALKTDDTHSLWNAEGFRRITELAAASDDMTVQEPAAGDLIAEQQDIVDRALLEVSAAHQAKSEFVSAMSHELRTPLHAIISFSEILQLAGNTVTDPAEVRDNAREIARAGTDLLKKINGILEYAAARSASNDLNETLVDPTELVSACLLDQSAAAARRNILIGCEIDQPGVMVTVDKAKMKRAIDALLSNAVKFTADGGHVSIRAGLVADGKFEIAITDTGIGIAAANLDKAFAPFSQVDGALNRAFEGMGLGLTLARLLTLQHKGDLAIETAPGEGTTVAIVLPAARVTVAAPEPEIGPEVEPEVEPARDTIRIMPSRKVAGRVSRLLAECRDYMNDDTAFTDCLPELVRI